MRSFVFIFQDEWKSDQIHGARMMGQNIGIKITKLLIIGWHQNRYIFREWQGEQEPKNTFSLFYNQKKRGARRIENINHFSVQRNRSIQKIHWHISAIWSPMGCCPFYEMLNSLQQNVTIRGLETIHITQPRVIPVLFKYRATLVLLRDGKGWSNFLLVKKTYLSHSSAKTK